jgi:hypothetical protein
MRRRFTREQKFFKDPNQPGKAETAFPSLFDEEPSKFLSIVAPAYQEVNHLSNNCCLH